jgi:hypothetical protein
MKKLLCHNSGHTLMELVMAIAVTGMLALVILAAYTSIAKTFAWHSRQAAQLRSMTLAKAELDAVFGSIQKCRIISPSVLEYTILSDSSFVALSFRSDTLFDAWSGAKIPCQEFGVRLHPQKMPDGRQVFAWHTLLDKNRWIGGAFKALPIQ